MCDEIIDAARKLSLTTKKQKQILMKGKQSVKRKISIFYLHFY